MGDFTFVYHVLTVEETDTFVEQTCWDLDEIELKPLHTIELTIEQIRALEKIRSSS